MYLHNLIYIQCPYCRFSIEVDSRFNSCYICGEHINSLEIDDKWDKKS